MANTTTHDALEKAAIAYLHSFRVRTPGSNDPDPDAIQSHLHPDCRADFGHSYLVSTMPQLQGQKSGAEFVTRLCGMASKLKTYSVDVVDTSVDVAKMTVVARAEMHMVPQHAEKVVQDALFWLVFDEESRKVVRCTEWVDAAATAELMRRMQIQTEA